MSARQALQWTARLWGVAGTVGIVVAVTIALKHPFPKLPAASSALLAVLFGWLIMLVLAPWWHMSRLTKYRETVSHLAHLLRRLNSESRDLPLSRIRLDRDDELGELTKALHDVLVQKAQSDSQSKQMARRMQETVKKETARATSTLRKQAHTDPLTGLDNRRAMDGHLTRLFNGERRRRRDTVSALIIDIDRFKLVNDTLGHGEGDRCLAALGDILRSALRKETPALRPGGDEFVVLLPNQPLEEARAVAQRIAALFAQMPWPHPSLPRPTLSIGIANVWSGDEHSAQELLQNADEALYRAKQSGRNAIVAFSDRRMVA